MGKQLDNKSDYWLMELEFLIKGQPFSCLLPWRRQAIALPPINKLSCTKTRLFVYVFIYFIFIHCVFTYVPPLPMSHKKQVYLKTKFDDLVNLVKLLIDGNTTFGFIDALTVN